MEPLWTVLIFYAFIVLAAIYTCQFSYIRDKWLTILDKSMCVNVCVCIYARSYVYVWEYICACLCCICSCSCVFTPLCVFISVQDF